MNAFASGDPRLLLRADLRDFDGYRSARSERVQGEVWLNANEACVPNVSDSVDALRRYPAPRPEALVDALASLYDCPPAHLLVGRGSDELIDLLVRACCMPGRDSVVVTPPVFGMYAVSARLHGVAVVDVPLVDAADDASVDFDAVAEAAIARDARLVFLCSPGNPLGGPVAREAVLALAKRLGGSALIVVDEAYIEFADVPSLATDVARQNNLVVLRTLSKAHALAGARIGCAIADPGVIEGLRRCQAPYPIAAPSAAAALSALMPEALAATQDRIVSTRVERDALIRALRTLTGVRRVYQSQANFVLVRFDDAEAAWQRLYAAGIVARDMRATPVLDDALRITIGTSEENRRVLAALGATA